MGTSKLSALKPQKLTAPLRMVIYGEPGTGKSTLAASAPSPIWLDIEDGSGRLNVARYEFRDGPGGHVPESYTQVLAALDDLATNPHDFKTVVIDTLDRLESLVWKHLCEVNRKENVEAFGFGKAYVIALDFWRALFLKLDRLRTARGMSIVMIGHSVIRTFKSPEHSDFDRYSMRIHDKAAGLAREWVDILGFACFEDGATSGQGERTKGFSTGRRLLKLERSAAYDAKSRYPLPAEVELDPSNPWAPFAAALSEGESMDVPALAALVVAEAERIGDAGITAKVAGAVKEAVAAGDIERLRRNLMALKRQPTKSSENQQAA